MIEGHNVAPLAARQRDVLRLIARYYEVAGEPPTLEILARRLSIDRKTVQQHLDALFSKGWLRTPSPSGLRCTHSPS